MSTSVANVPLIPLWKAASVAHRRLCPDQSRDGTVLDAIALALFKLMPIYARDAQGRLRELTEAEIDATSLEFRDRRGSLSELMASPQDLELAVRTLQLDSLQSARAALVSTHRHQTSCAR